jgi:hypothetical protein
MSAARGYIYRVEVGRSSRDNEEEMNLCGEGVV